MKNSDVRLLYVDDSKVIRGMLDSALTELGYTNVQSANDGIQALNLCDENKGENKFDFIITDINMPNMDGIEFITEVRTNLDYLDTPIMVLSIEKSDKMKEKGKNAGATSWIVKPFDKELLGKAISATIKKVQDIKENEKWQ